MIEKVKTKKAWLAREKDSFICAVVFAETIGKARALARLTGACEDSDWCDIEVNRLPKIDKYYKDGITEKCKVKPEIRPRTWAGSRKKEVSHENNKSKNGIERKQDVYGQRRGKSQASFNSDGCLVLRNYNQYGKDNDEIIILSENETGAIIRLFQKLKIYDILPFLGGKVYQDNLLRELLSTISQSARRVI